MRNNISLEYAEAMITLGAEEGKGEKFLSDLKMIKALIENEPQLIELLRSPAIAKEEKLSVIDAVFLGKAEEHVISLLKLMCENNRIELLPLTVENYEKLYNEINKVCVARVTSAKALTEDEKARLTMALEKKMRCKVQLECKIDKSIIGGLVVETEDAVIDGSVKRKIRDVKEVIDK